MAVFSKLVSPILRRVAAKNNLAVLPNREGHARLMKVRSTYFGWTRLKDHIHFYVLGIGVLPVLALNFFMNVTYGKCELRDETEDGYAPRYWQYEDTILKQYMAWLMWDNDMFDHEMRCADWYQEQMRILWRKQKARAEHLMGERGDYLAWSYFPVKTDWVNHSEMQTRRMQENFSTFTHQHF